MDHIDTSEQLWKGKVVRYRKWEQRHDRAVDPIARKNYKTVLAELYVDLSNTAREIVKRVTKESGVRWTDTEKPLRDEIWTSVYGSHRYTLKRSNEEPNRIWFQRNEHEPWFDLGYYNDMTREFQDMPIDRDLVMFHEPWTPKPDERKDMYERPEDLEAAAAHAMARAAELRAIDDSEPAGDEPTISWQYTPNYEVAPTYTYVAFKAANDRWYVTGDRQFGRGGVSWRELYANEHSAAIRDGDYLIVTEWSQVGGE